MFEEKKLQELKDMCRSRGVSLTPQRLAVMRVLTARRDHPTVDQLYDDLTEQMPGMSRTTVYRVLETFERLGLVRKIDSRASKAHFDADTSLHPHMVCLGCGKVVDYQDRGFGILEPPGITDDGFEIIDYAVTLVGYCRQCRRNVDN
ncbi:transcriptional regulator, Fur family [Syntrophotalea carbinolica DSM 2380]|uniref:Transcriptional regulator, Fur family n=1 Tax=Syntrophotalea carbinolica (strain DSM 2380 / NBRC 103641 / GraBd1) TaxID=338963 RepID=Q3A0S4_SYNC1|nr:Fur family transcriptional regulator [Syntrophotalea carbinolica]ABA90033.2 transcriptional regulator, Fur family [Syntrophotalea carbinolica DSM 2380]